MSYLTPEEIESAFSEILLLPDNWDSYGARSPRPSVVQAMREHLQERSANVVWITATGDEGIAVRYDWGSHRITAVFDADCEGAESITEDGVTLTRKIP